MVTSQVLHKVAEGALEGSLLIQTTAQTPKRGIRRRRIQGSVVNI